MPSLYSKIALSRRGLLGALALGGAAGLAGCQVDTGDAGGGSSTDATKIEFPDYSTTLTGDDVDFRWCDSGGLKSVFEESVLTAFTAKHANIKTKYQGSGWPTVNQVVPLGIRNHSAPDVFALPQGMPGATAVLQKWVQPLDQIIPDFDAWRSGFPDTAFVPGRHVFNDKIYSFPLSSDRRLSYMDFYDSGNMKAAGYDDPVEQITTWDDLHTALAKVVKIGKVGVMIGADGLSGVVTMLAQSAGWKAAGGMDFATGEYVYDAPEVIQAFEFLQKLATDKLIVPGFLTMKNADIRAQAPAGGAGMVFNGPWDIPAWKKTSPDWKYSVGRVPSPQGKEYIVPFEQDGSNNPWAYAESKLPEALGQIFAYMGSAEGQKMMVILSEGNLVSMIDSATEAADLPGLLDENAKRCTRLAKDQMRVAPLVALRNPDVAKVKLASKSVTPKWKDLMQGLFTGQIKDAKKQFADYNDALSQALDDAIEAAAKKGSTVTRDDYTFSNWDPSKDYTQADYDALG